MVTRIKKIKEKKKRKKRIPITKQNRTLMQIDSERKKRDNTKLNTCLNLRRENGKRE